LCSSIRVDLGTTNVNTGRRCQKQCSSDNRLSNGGWMVNDVGTDRRAYVSSLFEAAYQVMTHIDTPAAISVRMSRALLLDCVVVRHCGCDAGRSRQPQWICLIQRIITGVSIGLAGLGDVGVDAQELVGARVVVAVD
jgi:hypothetical protein